MKNLNYNNSNSQNIKFNKQVSHLSSFVGMPMWNGRNPTLSEIREFDRRVLEQQALGFEAKKQSIFVRLSKGLKQQISKALVLASSAKQKSANIKHGLSKPDVECCG